MVSRSTAPLERFPGDNGNLNHKFVHSIPVRNSSFSSSSTLFFPPKWPFGRASPGESSEWETYITHCHFPFQFVIQVARRGGRCCLLHLNGPLESYPESVVEHDGKLGSRAGAFHSSS